MDFPAEPLVGGILLAGLVALLALLVLLAWVARGFFAACPLPCADLDLGASEWRAAADPPPEPRDDFEGGAVVVRFVPDFLSVVVFRAAAIVCLFALTHVHRVSRGSWVRESSRRGSVRDFLNKPPPKFQINPRNDEAKLAGALRKRK